MRMFALRAMVPLIAMTAAGCLPRGRRYDYEAFAAFGGVVVSRRTAAENTASADEAGLENQARLEPIVRIVLARNADLLEEEERVRERLDRIPPSARLPDLELKYEQWGVPL